MVFRSGRQWSGLESDLARAYAARLGLRPVFVALPADRLPDALFDGRIDVVMAGLPITEANRVRMDFSSPYLVVGLGAAVRPADLSRFNTDIKIRSARGRVGVVEGSRGDAFVSSYFPHAQRAAFDSLADAENDLAEGQIDLLVHDAPSIWWSIRNRDSALAMAPVLFDRVEIAWGFRRGSVGLRESANRALADWQKDGSLEAAIARWLPVSR